MGQISIDRLRVDRPLKDQKLIAQRSVDEQNFIINR